MLDAQKALLHSESSEKLKKDLRHKTRTCKNVKLFYGDSVYYKQFNSRNTEMARESPQKRWSTGFVDVALARNNLNDYVSNTTNETESKVKSTAMVIILLMIMIRNVVVMIKIRILKIKNS